MVHTFRESSNLIFFLKIYLINSGMRPYTKKQTLGKVRPRPATRPYNPAHEVPLAHGAAARCRYDLPRQLAPTAHESYSAQEVT